MPGEAAGAALVPLLCSANPAMSAGSPANLQICGASFSIRRGIMLKFLAGLATGVGLAMIIAPVQGSEMRRRVRENLSDVTELPRRKANELLDRYEDKISRAGEQLGRQVAEAAVGKVKERINTRQTG
jgi:gas vesicle protein